MKAEERSPVVIYYDADKSVEVRLDAERETVWLTQKQMSDLFGKDVRTVNEHVLNIYEEEELTRNPTIRKFRIVHQEGSREVSREIEHYNLDVIISVGYRVRSQEGTRFRQWATRTLREHLTKGWTRNRQRLETNARELAAALRLVQTAASSPDLDLVAGRGLLDIVTRYAQTFLLLQRYDEGLLAEPAAQSGGTLPSVKEARVALAGLKSELMARRSDRTFCPRTGRGPRVDPRQSQSKRVRRARVSQHRGQGSRSSTTSGWLHSLCSWPNPTRRTRRR